MIEHHLDTESSVLYLHPTSALKKDDFLELAKTVDPFIEKTGALKGLIVEAPAFPGWETFGAMAQHFRFVRDHHRWIKKVGIVTDSLIGDVAERLASHFIAAEIRHFPAGQLETARQWVTGVPANAASSIT